jgi:hypothetical protein
MIFLKTIRPRLAFYLRGRQKFAMLVFAATRRHRVAFPASPKPPAGLDLFFRKEII